jgi:hypothetical protein
MHEESTKDARGCTPNLVQGEQSSPNLALGEQQSFVARRIALGVFVVRQIWGAGGGCPSFAGAFQRRSP